MRAETRDNPIWPAPMAAAAVVLCAAAGLLSGCAARPWMDPAQGVTTVRPQDSGEYERAWELVSLGLYEPAQHRFESYLASWGDSDAPAAGRAMFWVGYCLEKQGRPREAVEVYQRVIRRFGAGAPADMARRRMDRMRAH